MELDTDLYSRQIFALGLETVQSLSKLNVLVYGMGGLGLEISKNVTLTGPRAVTVVDNTLVSQADLGSFFCGASSVGQQRGSAAQMLLKQLNPYVNVEAQDELTDALLARHQVVIMANAKDAALVERVDAYCHAHSIGFIRADAGGLFASMFVDFGPEFVVKDRDGEERQAYVITGIERGNPTIISVNVDDEHPLTRELDDGNTVEIGEVLGMSQMNGVAAKIKLVDKFVAELDVDSSEFDVYKTGGILREQKEPLTVHFLPLSQAREQPGEFVMSDWSKWGRDAHLHCARRALDAFLLESQSQMPSSNQHVERIVELAKQLDAEVDTEIVKTYARHASKELNPVVAFLGGLVAQEALKFTGKFTPVQQFFYFDALEALPKDSAPARLVCDSHSRYAVQEAIFGTEFQQRLAQLKLFLVGSGALGCELLKNFAMMGVGCSAAEGWICVTDMDSIEKSNLNRQFLFRDTDIGQMKSMCAARAATLMNSECSILAKDVPVGPSTENVFDYGFWSSLDLVVNALDTWVARLYVDSKCVEFKKPLLESGTLGSTGHTQVIIPDMTLNFGATRIPPQKKDPACTIITFPHTINHAVQWAKEKFDTNFTVTPLEAAKHLHDPHYLETLLQRMNPAEKREMLSRVHSALKLAAEGSFAECVRSARLLFEEYFTNTVLRLLAEFPEDALDPEGNMFWSPPRRYPKAVYFDASNPLHMLFLRSTAYLLAFTHGIEEPEEVDWNSALARVEISSFVPPTRGQPPEDSAEVDRLLLAISQLRVGNFQSATFEKDDDRNHHVDFIHAVGSLRATNYHITPVTLLKTKQLSGNIVPAMVTTTSSITGLICLELCKIIAGGKTIEDYKEANLNLATNLLAFGEPQEPRPRKSNDEVVAVPNGFTLWDRIVIEGDLSVIGVAKYLGANYNVKLQAITCDGMSLYASHDAKNRETRARQKLTAIYCELRDLERLPDHAYSFELILMCSDKATGKPVCFPTVVLHYGKAYHGRGKNKQNDSKKKKKKKKKKKRKY